MTQKYAGSNHNFKVFAPLSDFNWSGNCFCIPDFCEIKKDSPPNLSHWKDSLSKIDEEELASISHWLSFKWSDDDILKSSEKIKMTSHQEIFAIIVSVALLLFILELVRRRKIKEEYSWLWILAGVLMVLLVVWPGLLLFLTHLTGAESPANTIFLFGFIFLLFINIDYSVRISAYKEQIKKLAQRIGILSKEVKD